MKVHIRDEIFELHSANVLIWPAQKLLVVADIHLGKAQTFLKNGLWLPPQAHTSDLTKLTAVAQSFAIEHILFLGDFIHSPEGVTHEVIAEFQNWKANFTGQVTIVIGNHDRPFMKDWPASWNFANQADSLRIGNFIFQHEPPETQQPEFVWCGHIHPKVSLKQAGDNLYLPAFVITPEVGYLPAFSSLAGGANFTYRKSNRYYVSNRNHVVEVVF